LKDVSKSPLVTWLKKLPSDKTTKKSPAEKKGKGWSMSLMEAITKHSFGPYFIKPVILDSLGHEKSKPFTSCLLKLEKIGKELESIMKAKEEIERIFPLLMSLSITDVPSPSYRATKSTKSVCQQELDYAVQLVRFNLKTILESNKEYQKSLETFGDILQCRKKVDELIQYASQARTDKQYFEWLNGAQRIKATKWDKLHAYFRRNSIENIETSFEAETESVQPYASPNSWRSSWSGTQSFGSASGDSSLSSIFSR